jgi:CDP-4-dehydro-6-deoxyglucose reductase
MPAARQLKCTIIEKIWVTPTVMKIRFMPEKRFLFEPGQFISIVVPTSFTGGSVVKRAYSFSSGPEESLESGYELCVKFTPNGIGTGYLATLKVGDVMTAFAPYGDFTYQPPAQDHHVCFVSTGTGIAPFKSVARSVRFRDYPPREALCLFGAPTEKEIIYPGVFEDSGIKVVNAIDMQSDTTHFRGRVTDYLKMLPPDWHWHTTDFYICGNPFMVADVHRFLRDAKGVADKHIHQESFTPPQNLKKAA